jgi:type II secretory pathway component PulJ
MYLISRGFTLVEMLVYIALLLVGMVTAISVVLSLQGPLNNSAADRLLYQNADFILGQLTETARNADAVDVVDSTFDASPGTVVFTTGSGEVEFALVSGDVVKAVDGITLGPLNNSDVAIQRFVVRRLQNTATEGVRYEMVLAATVNAVTKHATFTTSAMIKSSYE